MQRARQQGFSLIEMSIVLVIIGLIVGGILVGKDLIRASGVRATLTQIEKFNTAANTFFEKYGYLPGDIPAGPAAQFGFAPRGQYPGEGDGNGSLQGNWQNTPGGNLGYVFTDGETVMFWVDLSKAGLIDGGFSTASSTVAAGTVTLTSTPNIDAYFPQAKLGKGNYIYVSDTLLTLGGTSVQRNYFGLAGVSEIGNVSGCDGCIATSALLTVAEAYSIDNKIDDGLPYNGNVTAVWLNPFPGFVNAAASNSAITCMNYSNTYSIKYNNGAGVNCALAFRMQAGD